MHAWYLYLSKSLSYRYGIHLWDVGHTTMWEGRSTWSYNTDLTMSLAMYIVDFAHHMHMLVRKKNHCLQLFQSTLNFLSCRFWYSKYHAIFLHFSYGQTSSWVWPAWCCACNFDISSMKSRKSWPSTGIISESLSVWNQGEWKFCFSIYLCSAILAKLQTFLNATA